MKKTRIALVQTSGKIVYRGSGSFENKDKDRIVNILFFLLKKYLDIQKAVDELDAVEEDNFKISLMDGDKIVIDVNPEKRFVNKSDMYPEDFNALSKEKRNQLVVNSLLNKEFVLFLEKDSFDEVEIGINDREYVEEFHPDTILTIKEAKEKIKDKRHKKAPHIESKLALISKGIVEIDFDPIA